ncbi:patatin-like phospholipase family protein [Mangrovibacterium sp.]|uniref:patatin-like phospholipase family protein n=1 Tax=Mangrovibacterium sp. TaxID=1961364 RepID=UPI003567B9DE
MRSSALAIIFLLIYTSLSAQKVAVVLSGGGAKGLAHIGVIRALEENDIPIDYIAGTSMGAIVAGLYAAGYSPDEMEILFKSDQFKFWSTGIIQEEYRYFFSKLEETPSYFSIDLKKQEDKLKILLPTNIIPEEQMDFAFMEMFSATNAVCNYNFNNLFVPFFCIATDVYDNKEVQLSSGDLGEAIRASMTFPFYFKPIVIDGSLVFDGGIVNNFPVKNALETFNPDIVIGHKVANNAIRPDEDDMMAQLENLIMQKTNYQIPGDKGILIESSFTDIGLLDFGKIDQINQTGYDNTISIIDSIAHRITRRTPIKEVQSRREEFERRKPELKFENVQVEGISDPLQRKYLIQSIKHRSDVIDLDELRKEYFKLVSDPQIKSIRPISIYNPQTGYFDLHLKVKPENQLEIQFGGNVSTKPINQGFLSLDYRFFKNRAYTLSTNIYFGRIYSSIKTGGRIDFPTKLPFYLSGYLTFNRWDYYNTSSEFFFENVLAPSVISNENSLRFEAGIPMWTHGKLMLSASFNDMSDKYYLVPLILESDTQDKTTFNSFSSSLTFEENSFNYKQFPDEGRAAKLAATFITGEEVFKPGTNSSESEIFTASQSNHSFWKLQANYDKYIKIRSNYKVGLFAEGVYSNKELFSNYYSSILSAPDFSPTPFSKTLVTDNFRANRYVAGGLKTVLNLSDQLHFRMEGYGFLPMRKIASDENSLATYSDFSPKETKIMGLGGLVYQSAAGPISLTLNYLENENTKWYLVFSFGYVLFNKRGY